ncbi:MAG: gliding motility protein GldN [Marinilabiliales bacterium]|nr:gliding motility protein GldN [Marinilabiliales bacterium]
MRRNLIFLVILLMGSLTTPLLHGQGIEELFRNKHAGIFEKKITQERKPAPLPNPREADVTWSKTVWRLIDMREKMNQQFYFPTREIQGRLNLINILLKGIKDQSITAFDAPIMDENEFSTPITYDQVKAQFGATTKTIQRRNFENGQMEDVSVKDTMHTEDVKQFIIKELWFFDKQKSTLQVRILGICPIRLYYRDEDVNQEQLLRKKLFWVWYPEIRKLLAKNETLNTRNGARNYSFDDLFLIRYFDGYIIKEENVYDNRSILQYASDEYASKESDRIKNSIFNYEQDLWEY